MSTSSTANLTKQLIAALAAAMPSGRFYVNRPPDDAVYPYTVVRLMLRTDPNFDNTRMTGTLECVVFARPRSTAQAAEAIADGILTTFAGYRATAGSGVTFGTGLQRDTLPAFQAPADSDVTAIRVASTLTVWPQLFIGP